LAAALREQDRLGKLDLEKGLLFLSLRRARFDCDRGERAQKGFELAANELVQCHVQMSFNEWFVSCHELSLIINFPAFSVSRVH
jgi:hypothetical protein